MFYPYRIEFIKDSITNIIDPFIFKDNPYAKDLNNIGTTTEALRIVNLYFPGAIFTVKDINSNSRAIKYNGEILGYLVGNVYRY